MNLKIKSFFRKQKIIIIIFIMLLLPVILPIFISILNKNFCDNYKEWFMVYGDFASNIIGMFIALLAVLYEINKSTVEKNRSYRINLYEKLSDEILEIKNDTKDLINQYLNIYMMRDLDKYKKNHKMFVGSISYMKLTEDEENWTRELLEERLENLTKIELLEGKIYEKLNVFLSKEIWTRPIDEIEEVDLRYLEIKNYMKELIEIKEELRSNIIDLSIEKNKIEERFSEDDKNYIESFCETLNEKSKLFYNMNRNLDLVHIYINYTEVYLQCDLIYSDNQWKSDLLMDYEYEVDNALNREEKLKEIFKK